MKKSINGKIVEITPEEIAEQQAQAEQEEHNYWISIDYNEAVVNEIRKKYDINAELAIQRQRFEKIEEYQTYFDYCEECKIFVKEKFSQAGRET